MIGCRVVDSAHANGLNRSYWMGKWSSVEGLDLSRSILITFLMAVVTRFIPRVKDRDLRGAGKLVGLGTGLTYKFPR